MKRENLRITSADNPDWCGCWKRQEVEQEMKELGFSEHEFGAWRWVLDHVFDSFCGDVPDHDELAGLIEDGTVEEIVLRLKEGSVKIKQF